jgi:hypothetical protein
MANLLPFNRALRTTAIYLSISVLPLPSDAQTSSSVGPLQFQLTFSNPNTAPIYLTKAGLQVRPIFGSSACKGFGRVTAPLATFVISFLVTEARLVTVEADPPLSIPPKQTVTFTLAAAPVDAGSCGAWAVQVTPVFFFSNGTDVTGSTHQITEDDLHRFKSLTPGDEKLIEYLTNSRGDVRAQGLEFLLTANAQFDDLYLVGLLRHKFTDPDPRVRALAAEITGQRRLSVFSKEIARLLTTLGPPSYKTQEERKSYILALGRIGGAEASNLVYKEAQLCDANATADGCKASLEAAKILNDVWIPKEAEKLLNSFLLSNTSNFDFAGREIWNNGKLVSKSPDFPHFGNTWILITYRWATSAPLFAKLLSDRKYHVGVMPLVLRSLAGIVKKYDSNGTLLLPPSTEEDPFIARNREEYRKLTSDPDQYVRGDAIFLYFITSRDVNDVKTLVRDSLSDVEESISTIGAQAAANLGLTEHLDAIKSKYDKSDNIYSKGIYCKSLKALGQKIDCTL